MASSIRAMPENEKPPAKRVDVYLCTDKNNMDVEYASGGLSNQIFASEYVLYMPDKEQFRRYK